MTFSRHLVVALVLADAVVGLCAACSRPTISDGGTPGDVGLDGGSGPVLSPNEIFGRNLVLWLDADEPTTITLDADGSVVSWASRVSSESKVVAAFPLLSRNGITRDLVAANGRPAIHVGALRGMLESGQLFDGAVPLLIAVVGSYENPPLETGIMFMMPSANVYIRGNSKGRTIVTAGAGSGSVATTADGWNDTKLHSFGLTGKIVRADGVPNGPWPGLYDAKGESAVMIGGQISHSTVDGAAIATPIQEPLDGHIAEVIMAWNTSGTPTEIAQLSAYFQRKYGVPF